MRRILGACLLTALATLAACSSGSVGAAGSSSTTRLESALLQPKDMRGWERVTGELGPPDATVDPPACQALYDQTLGRQTSDRGAGVTYLRGVQSLRQYLDPVSRGADSVQSIQQAVASCPAFSTVEAGERNTVTVSPLPVPALGEQSYGVILRIDGGYQAELPYLWVGHRDVLMLLQLDGPEPDAPTLVQVAEVATKRLQAKI